MLAYGCQLMIAPIGTCFSWRELRVIRENQHSAGFDVAYTTNVAIITVDVMTSHDFLIQSRCGERLMLMLQHVKLSCFQRGYGFQPKKPTAESQTSGCQSGASSCLKLARLETAVFYGDRRRKAVLSLQPPCFCSNVDLRGSRQRTVAVPTAWFVSILTLDEEQTIG